MRVVIDINIIVSALIAPTGKPAAIIRTWLDGKFMLLTCAAHVDELRSTLQKPRVSERIRPHKAGRLVNQIKRFAEDVGVLPPVVRSPDPMDDFLLAMCEAGHADYLVTGDKSGFLVCSVATRRRRLFPRGNSSRFSILAPPHGGKMIPKETAMNSKNTHMLTRREFVGATAGAAASFMIVPRHVLGRGYTPPSDRVAVASIGMGRQGQAVTMELLAHADVQVVAVCDCNKFSKNYAEYGDNDLLKSARQLLGPGYENWGEDLASPGRVQLTHEFSTSLGMVDVTPRNGWWKPTTVPAKAPPPVPTRAARPTAIFVNCSTKNTILTPFMLPRPITGTPQSQWRPCVSTSTFCVRSR
jgi:putative PIN family toxin of toxin-antitoxin system